MRFFIALLVAGVTAVALIAFAAPANHGLIVHEWGTFTSVQGSDGTLLEGLQREEEPLPPFVHTLSPYVHSYGKGLTYPAIHVTQKMETPVLYFYTQEKQQVRVNVEFKHGLLSQWYPRVTAVKPVEENKPFDLSQLDQSSLQWDVELTPANAEQAATSRSLEQPVYGNPWNFARQVASAAVRVPPSPDFPVAEGERFLFYRGLGNFTLPIAIRADKGGQASVHNSSTSDLPMAFALEVTEAGGRYTEVGKVAAGATIGFSLDKIPFGETGDVTAELKAKVQTALLNQGLFEDEAKAMVNTWSRQWFSSWGTRLLYLVPRETTDALLPLQITPAPEKIIRVLVGRLEYMTPETEAQVIRVLGNSKTTSPAFQTILYGSDRFLEPYVRRALALSEDDAVRQAAHKILTALKPAS